MTRMKHSQGKATEDPLPIGKPAMPIRYNLIIEDSRGAGKGLAYQPKGTLVLSLGTKVLF